MKKWCFKKNIRVFILLYSLNLQTFNMRKYKRKIRKTLRKKRLRKSYKKKT